MGQVFSSLRRAFRRYTVTADWVEVILLLIMGVLAVNTVSESAWLAIGAGALYFFFLCLKVWLTFGDRKATDQLKGDVLWGLFDLVNDRIFNCDSYIRFTLFRVDPSDHSYIIPWYRYEKASGTDPVDAAEKSSARYKRGEGHTGKAWASAGQNRFQMAILPTFSDRPSFKQHYCSTLGINESTVDKLSAYMLEVGLILSLAVTDTRGKLLGVLSIDCQWACKSYSPLEFIAPDGTSRTMTLQKLVVVAVLVHNVLRSFASSESRRRT